MTDNSNVKILFLALLIFVCNLSFAQFEFIENKGQWHENVLYRTNLNNGAIFLESNCITYNFFRDGDMQFSVAHHQSEGEHYDLVKNFHAYKVFFRNSNENPKVTAYDQSKDYLNFFIGNDKSKWASFVRKYQSVYYHELYNGIDFKFYQNHVGLKYDFIVKPGADPSNIVMEYQGVDNILISNGNLVIYTSVNEVYELEPYAFQIINNDTVEVKCSYNLRRNRVSFSLAESYNPDYELIIDPNLVFSTYTGSTGDNWGFTATWDYNDNVYAGGIVFDVGYPTSTGAYQINFAGGSPANPNNPNWYANGCDIGIIKYNEDGTERIFATYLGGTTGQEMPHSLVVTESNDLIILGTTGSSDFPTSANAFRNYFMGGDSVVYDNVIAFPHGTDLFVTKISENGSQLLGSTYIGGSSNDGLNFKIHYTYPDPVTNINWVKQHGNDSLYANYGDGARGEVIVDDKNMIYVGTTTFSTDFSQGMFPGFQPNNGGGQDGIVFKLSPDLSQLVWSSYIGGSQDDAVFSVALNDNYDVLVAGATVSHDFPTTPESFSPGFNGGNTDAFVSKISTEGGALLSSTFYGSSAFDNAFFVRTDRFNNVFICGQTKAPGTTLVHNANYYIPNSGQYIAKFSPNLSELEWSTVFGTGNGKPNISISAFAVDVCDRIYIAGWGRDWPFSYYNSNGDFYTWDDTFGTKGMEVTPDAIQTETDGMDFYIMVLSDDASELEYATFFGELRYAACGASGRDHVDGGTSRFDKKGHVIQSVCASCGGCQEFPVYPDNAWSTTNNATNCNNAVFKIRIIENLAAANFEPVEAGCVPYTVEFNNNSQGNVVEWDFGDGNTSTETNPTHTYTEGGEFTVQLIVNDPLSCNINDTMSRVITVIEPTASELPDIEICPGEQVIIGPGTNYPSGTTFTWVQGSNLNNFNIQNPLATPEETTQYLLIASGVCVDSIWQTVVIHEPDLELIVPDDIFICPGEQVVLNASSPSNVDGWQWSDSPTFANILSETESLSVSPTSSGFYYVRVIEDVCNTYVTEQVYVEVHEFNYTLNPSTIICLGDNANLTVTNYNPSDELSYIWSPTNSIVSGHTTNSPTVSPDVTTTYYVTITNQIGCETTDEVLVEVRDVTFNAPEIFNNLCYEDCEGVATVSAEGTPPYQFSWSNDNQGITASDLCAGIYEVTVTDNLGCTNTTSIEITQPPELLGNFTNVQEPECDGVGFGSATINAIGGTPDYSFSWSYGGNQQTNNTLLVGNNTVTITDNNNCQTIESIYMPAPGDLISEISEFNMISCYGYCDGSINVSADLGLEPYSYYWQDGFGNPIDETGNELEDLCPGQYIVTIIDSENCVTHQQMWITQPDSLIATATAVQEILCYGQTGTVGVNISGGTFPYSYYWENGSNESTIPNVEVGIYYVTVVDNNGCVDSSVVYLDQPPELEIDTLIRNMICAGVCNGKIEVNTFGGTPPYNYNWNIDYSSSTVKDLCEGHYYLTLTDDNGCEYIENFYIYNIDYIPFLEVGADQYIVFQGEEVNLFANAPQGSSFVWNPSESLNNNIISNPVATPEITTLYQVRITDSIGCTNIDTLRIHVKEVICGDPFIFTPNAFTPNGDGVNDYFMVNFPPALVTELYMAVFNRWGEVVFETNNINDKGWDGTYKGVKVGTDVFVYMLRVRCLDGQIYEEKGNVTLLR